MSWAVEQRARIAVVTNAPRANARHVLEVLHLDQQFELIMGAEEVAQPKPHAEPYLRTAKALGVPVPRCFAFEDSPPGVRSAVAAGIAVAALTTGHTALELEREGATPVVPDSTHASLWEAVRALASSLT